MGTIVRAVKGQRDDELNAEVGDQQRRPRRRVTESTTLSVNDWRMSRLRDAPRASRTEVCERRAAPRASSRLAMLAQAINSTRQQTVSRMRRLSP